MTQHAAVPSANPQESVMQSKHRTAAEKMSEAEYRQAMADFEADIARAKVLLLEPCTLVVKIERKREVRNAEEALRQHKLNYFELVDACERRSEATCATVSQIASEYGIAEHGLDVPTIQRLAKALKAGWNQYAKQYFVAANKVGIRTSEGAYVWLTPDPKFGYRELKATCTSEGATAVRFGKGEMR